MVQVTLGLLLVVLSIFALAWILRRYGRFQSTAKGAIKIIAGLSVGPRERVVLLQVGEKQVVLGVAPGRVQMLHELDSQHHVSVDESQDAADKRQVFASLLKREQ